MWIEKRGDMVTAYAFCQAAVSIGLHAIPPDFHWDRSRMEWGHLENRPFMRAYHNLAIHRTKQKAWEARIEEAMTTEPSPWLKVICALTTWMG